MKFELIYPMFAMFCLTVVVFISLFKARINSVKSGVVSPAYFLTYSTGEKETENARKLSRHFVNIFEAPTLFYIVCILVMMTESTNLMFFYLAWVYVVCRALHAYIHAGKNSLRPRIAIYFAGWLALTAMWVTLVAQIAQNSG